MSGLDLHALAAMPGAGQAAHIIRQRVDPLWGRGLDGEIEFEVEVEYEVKETNYDTFKVQASDDTAAQKMAELLFDKRHVGDDVEVVCVTVTPVVKA